MQFLFIEESKSKIKTIPKSCYLRIFNKRIIPVTIINGINSVHTCTQFAVVPTSIPFLNFQILDNGQPDRLDPPL